MNGAKQVVWIGTLPCGGNAAYLCLELQVAHNALTYC